MVLLRTLLSRESIALGLRALRAHLLRSFLTALGIIFGVAAVICMSAIGAGASAEQMENIRLLGSENIILRSVEPPDAKPTGDAKSVTKKYGLTDADLERVAQLPYVREIVRMREVANEIVRDARRGEGAVLGTSENLFRVANLPVARGRLLADSDARQHLKVCVIGDEIARELFPHEDPLGQSVAVVSPSTGAIPYEIVGVLAPHIAAAGAVKGIGARDVNRDLYIPLAVADLRYGQMRIKFQSGSREIKEVQYSDVYVNLVEQENVRSAARMIEEVLRFGHREPDYNVVVPLELLRQAEQSKQIWQIVLGSIAGLSLLVGGIGIMNIMLASVSERKREIGIRRVLGARRSHIMAQFLMETVVLSVFGGVIGIVVGIGFAGLITWSVGWNTIIPWWGVIISIMVSAVVGIVFGLYPARSAAGVEPVEALRCE